MRTQTLFTFAVAALSFGACRIEKPATKVPAPPSIESLTASATQVARGGKVNLSWKVANATSIELTEAATGALPVDATTFEGTFEATVDQRSLFVLVARGAGGSDARAVTVDLLEGGATSVTFQALPPTVAGGAQTTLAWSAPGARQVTLTGGTQTIDLAGQLASGAVTVRPLSDTTYTLTADGVAKSVNVVVQPAILTLEATPAAVQPGDAITLRWTAAGADKIVVSAPGRGDLSTVTTLADVQDGTFTETAPNLAPGSFLTYTVTASKGTASLAKTVQVYVGSGLSIVSFNAPAVAAAGQSYGVRWTTLAATQVQLKVDGAVVHQTANAQQAASGNYVFTAPMADFTVELIATDERSGRRAQVAQVDAVGVPTTLTFAASPTTAAAGARVTLTWTCPEARSVRVVDSDNVTVFTVTGQRAEGGSFDVYPNANTTWTATADNQLGSAPLTAMASVTVTGTPLTVVQTPSTALTGQMVDLGSSATNALYVGFPHSQVLTSTQADFLDISTTGTRVLESGGNVVSVTPPFSTLLWGVTQSGALTISRAGWIAWGGPLVVNSSEVSLPSTSTSAAPFLIAPYWDDLTLTANSAVFTQLVGEAPDQSYVVQWNKMQCGTSTGTEATFQVRVHQNGNVSFHYKTMTLNTSPTFTIGVQDGTRTLAVKSTATPASNTALYFFSPVSVPSVRVTKGSSWGGFVKAGNATTRISQTAAAYVFPTDLALTEFMFRPAPTVAKGQWLEVLNRTAAPLDMTGWSISTLTTQTSFTLAPGTTLTPGVPTIFGDSTNPAENDDAGVNVAWGTLTFARDAGAIVFGNADASVTLTYSGPSDGGVGSSVEVDPGPFLTTALGSTPTFVACQATRPFGFQVPQQLGTPGTVGSCFGYRVSSIPSRYVDISDAGTPLLVSGFPIDGKTVAVTLAATGSDPAPLGFGVRQPVVSMSNDGWMVWGSTTSTNFSNETYPNSGAPTGALAPFWDDLEAAVTTTRSPEMYWKRFNLNEDPVTTAPHWVFSWHHMSHYYSSGKGADDLNFEVKLFEDGTIEYHYGTMVSGTTSNYANGNSATVWLENPAGTIALSQSVNQPVVAPNTAWRFTPAN
ncbi:MAG: hypothetical protein U0228_30075 [Myxococcaceae bacterium]